MVLGISAVAVVFQRNPLDSFRLVKLALYETEAVICLALLLLLLVWRRNEVVAELRRHGFALAIVGLAVAWTAITALTSTNRVLSIPAFIWVVSCAIVFIATLLTASREAGLLMIQLPLVTAALNAVITLAQRFHVWSPAAYSDSLMERMRASGLIGNINDLGVYFVPWTLAAAALCIVSVRKRWRYGALSALLVLGLVASDTKTAMIAILICGLLLIAMETRHKKAVLAGIVLLTAVALLSPSVRSRIETIAHEARQGSLTELTSNRVPTFVVTWHMFRDHPWVGMGPGTFSWWYLPYKLQADATNADFRKSTEHFGEAHNDHLQTLAVAGIPGYAILLAAIVYLAACGSRPRGEEVRARFAKAMSIPLAAGFFIVALAQFPLELASTASAFIHIAALCCAWSLER